MNVKPMLRHSGGYVLVHRPGHPRADKFGYVYEHRLVVEEAGIEIPAGYHVHHKNGVKDDNRLENLELVSPSEHPQLHAAERTGLDAADILELFRAGTTSAEFAAMGVWQHRLARVKREAGISGVWARQRPPKTHCKHGHEFTSATTYIDGRGERSCLVCRRSRRVRSAA